jgi:hypothetical protein
MVLRPANPRARVVHHAVAEHGVRRGPQHRDRGRVDWIRVSVPQGVLEQRQHQDHPPVFGDAQRVGILGCGA